MATKKHSKLATWTLIPVLVVVLVTLILVYKNNQSRPSQPLTGYKTYQDQTYGFSIEYPRAWEIKKDTQVFENGDVVAFRKTGPSQKKYTELSDGAQLAVSRPFVIDIDLTTWMKGYFSPQAKFSKLLLSNYSFEVAEDCEYMECMRYYFTKINNQIYGVALYAEGSTAEKASYENALLYMLKSLRFTSPENGIVSTEDAVTKVKALPEVKDFLKRVPNGLVAINGDDDNGYMVQVYEVKDGHTATFNWYTVDKTTGEVEKQF